MEIGNVFVLMACGWCEFRAHRMLSLQQTQMGEVWTCLVTPNDGSEEGLCGASTDSINGDSDGDGVLDVDDVCPGYDDTLDSNGSILMVATA